MAETVFLSIALFTAFSGSPVRTAASVGVKTGNQRTVSQNHAVRAAPVVALEKR